MTPKKKSTASTNKNISINGDVRGSIVSVGDNNIIQKIVNYIFPSEKETLEQRNRRILLNHVENAWIKGVLDASLHGAALLDLGIKQDPEAVTKYPWAIKKESTDETLPAGTSMLEIFDSIGMGRSLLILGAPGSGKTTMLLELARQLIAHAREDVTQPIPMVFNLASWTEKLTLADWLAQELNNLYSVPRKTAPDWVKGDKLLLLLDGLDEVRQESRAKCVEAINAFRKQNGLTSLAVCSRSQDYADLNAKLSFEGAIEVQPLTQGQITEFFNRFGGEMAGIKQALEKDSELREMAETPLFLSIMIMAYRDKRDVEILLSGDEKTRRKHLFDTYIERMFERPRVKNVSFPESSTIYWLSWLARKMSIFNQVLYLIENMQPNWLNQNKRRFFRLIFGFIFTWFFGWISGLLFTNSIGFVGGIILGLMGAFVVGYNIEVINWKKGLIFGLLSGLISTIIWGTRLEEPQKTIVLLICSPVVSLISGLIFGLLSGLFTGLSGESSITTLNKLSWDWRKGLASGAVGCAVGGLGSLVIYVGTLMLINAHAFDTPEFGGVGEVVSGIFLLIIAILIFPFSTLAFSIIGGLVGGFTFKPVSQTIYPAQGIVFSIKNSFFVLLLTGLIGGLIIGLLGEVVFNLGISQIGFLELAFWMFFVPLMGLKFGGFSVIQHYALRFIIYRSNLLPWRLVPFLDHCVDLIFLRRVGGGYIFVHRLLMEHFAEMYEKS
jgi:hypothetical protein